MLEAEKFAILFKSFYKQRQAEIGKKNQAKAKQHSEAEHLLFENYSFPSSKNNSRYSKKCTKIC